MTILYETIRKILHFLASTIWYLMVPSILLLDLWPCWLDGEVATLQSPLIMAGPLDWSDCGPLATWAGNEWVVLSTLCFNIQCYSLICEGDKRLVLLLHTIHAFVRKWHDCNKYLILKHFCWIRNLLIWSQWLFWLQKQKADGVYNGIPTSKPICDYLKDRLRKTLLKHRHTKCETSWQ